MLINLITKYLYHCLIIINILNTVLCKSAVSTTDSLFNIINISKEDSNIVKVYKELAWEFAYTDADSALNLCRKALSVSVKNDYERGTGDCFNTLGTFYYLLNSYDSALYYYNKAIGLARKLHYNKTLASAYSNIALTYNALCEYDKSIEFGFHALELREMAADTPGISKSLNNIGATFHYMGRHNTAIKFYLESLKLKEQLGDKQDISSTCNNIALIYFEKGIDDGKVYFDSSLIYNYKALNLRKEINFNAGIAESCINIGNVFSEVGDPDKALHYYKLSENIYSRLENNAGLATLLYNIAYLHFRKNQLDSAINKYLESAEIAKNINNLDLLKDNYSSLAELYALKKIYYKAYEYGSLYNTLYDSIFTLESTRLIEEIRTGYEAQKSENRQLKLDSSKRLLKLKLTRIILGIAIIVAIVVAMMLFYVIKSLKSSKKTTKMLVDQNFIVTQKSEIIQDNINYARIIQTSLLPSHEDLKTLFPDSFILSMPKDIVGGDFIWYKKIDGLKIIAMVDCTGHGVSAAFMSVIGNTLLNKIIIEEGTLDTCKILYKLNLYITGMLSKGTEKDYIMDGMDIALCTIKKDMLHFSGSQMPICVISDGNLNLIKGTRFSIGGNLLNKKCEFACEKIKIKKGDYLYMFTDGYYDQFGGEQYRPLRFKNFQNMLLANHKLSMTRQKEIFYNHMIVWIGEYEQLDDITLLGIKI